MYLEFYIGVVHSEIEEVTYREYFDFLKIYFIFIKTSSKPPPTSVFEKQHITFLRILYRTVWFSL